MSGNSPSPHYVSTSRAKLHEIYEDSLVEIRPLGAGPRDWVQAPQLIQGRGIPGVVITAWNPGKVRPDLADNEAANQRLLMELKASGHEIWEADGYSADHQHREPGFIAWEMSPEVGCQIAQKFDQYAIFYYRADGSRAVISVESRLA